MSPFNSLTLAYILTLAFSLSGSYQGIAQERIVSRSQSSNEKSESSKPNIVFILADDLGWSDTSLFGTTTYYQTPNIERLAQKGMTFPRAYSASPLCSPTRASILTGLSPARHGITSPTCHLPEVRLHAEINDRGPSNQKATIPKSATRLDTKHRTIAETLREAGYATGHFGKWHLGKAPYSPLEHGFDLDVPHWHGPGPAGSYVAPWKFPDFDHDPDIPDEHIEDRMAKEASKFIEEHKDEPFFLNYWMFSVHAPFDAKAELIKKYEKSVNPDDEQRCPTYAAMIESMDDAVGTLMDSLEEAGVADNTIIIFASDNGGNMYNEVQGESPTSNRPLRGGKATMYEGGVRGPCIITWPGHVASGTRNNTIVQSMDFYPTILDMLGIEKERKQQFDGISLLPVLGGETIEDRAIFTYFPHQPRVPEWLPPSASVHKKNWKLIRIFHGGEKGAHRFKLFDLAKDIGETKDVSREQPEIVKQLNQLIEEHLIESNAVRPLINPMFDPSQYDINKEGVQARKKVSKPKDTAKKTSKPARRDVEPPVFVPGQPVQLSQPSMTKDVEFEGLKNGGFKLSTTGGDPFIVFPYPKDAELSKYQTLELHYFSTTGINKVETRLMANRKWQPRIDCKRIPIAEGSSIAKLPLIDSAATEKFNPSHLRIDFGQHANQQIEIRKLLLRELSNEEKRKKQAKRKAIREKKAQANRIRNYLEKRYQSSIDEVIVEEKSIVLRGESASHSEKPLLLCELVPHVPSASEVPAAIQVTEIPAGKFVITVPRFDRKRDRVTSRWQLLEFETGSSGSAQSHAKWVTRMRHSHAGASDTGERSSPIPWKKLKNAKGMGGVSSRFGLEELVELGVKHITVNLVLTDLLSETQEPGTTQFFHDGKVWWVREARLAEADRIVRFASQRNIIVAAILLIPQASDDIIVHPDSANSGVYAMPNLTDPVAAQKYIAILDFIAARYGAPAHRGRVDHWIAHNEVDFAWQWTNMGEQPAEVMLDHYHRSMRIISIQTQRHNPNSRVFISLTHHFNYPHADWKSYSSRTLLDLVAAFNRCEGNFDWGVAHHPYPPSLFQPMKWPSAQVKNDFDTPMITMKNLGVLKRFLSQPRFLDADGELRPVLLSEQGYHAPEESTDAQELQVKAFLYAWQRMQEEDFVLAFDNHRWVDHPKEGGLRLGIRGLPTAEQVSGNKKLAWELYRDLSTDREANWRERFPSEAE